MHSLQFIAPAASLFLAISSLVAADLAPFNNSQAVAEGVFGNYTRQAYLSNPFVVGPVANVIVPPQEGVSPSKYVGWAPGGPRLPEAQPMLIDANNFATVWSGPAMDSQTMGPTVQSCNGTDYITWWAGADVDGHKEGRFYMVNNRYEMVYNITPAAPLNASDAHEITLTPQCTAIITAYAVHQHDLSAWNITDGWLIESYFQEIDLATGELLFHWQASKHIDLVADTIYRPPIKEQGLSKEVGHDWFHVNSVTKDHLGNYLISARHACAVFYISGINGAVIWRLGGPRNDFKDMSGGKATDFAWQHHARWLDHNLTRLSLYDDRSAGPLHISQDPLSRGIILELDYDKREVRLDRTYYATRGIRSDREGSMQVLMDSPTPGNVMLGYGQEPAWTEFSENGTVLLDVAFGPLFLERDSPDNYRALKVNWTGFPHWGPSIAAGPPQIFAFDADRETFSVRLYDDFGAPITNDSVYISWNGATEIKSWVILASNDTTNLTVADHFFAEVPKIGFEEHLFVGSKTKYVAAVAINGSDFVLGASDVIQMDSHDFYIGPAGHHHNETEALTEAWQKFVAAQPANSLFNRIRSKWHQVKAQVLRPSTPLAAGVSTFALLFLLTLCIVPATLYFRGRRGYSRAQRDSYQFSDELSGLKDKNNACFDVGLDEDNNDDDDNNSERTYYDEPEYPNKGSLDNEGDISTLRSSSSSRSKDAA